MYSLFEFLKATIQSCSPYRDPIIDVNSNSEHCYYGEHDDIVDFTKIEQLYNYNYMNNLKIQFGPNCECRIDITLYFIVPNCGGA